MNYFIILSIVALCHCRPQDGIQNTGVENEGKISYLPYYGGAKGQFLKVIESQNGTIISSQIIQADEIPKEDPPKTETEKPNEEKKEINKEIRSIHETAQNIIKLQAAAKKNGQLSEAEEKQYNENLEQLNLAAKNLANFQESQAEEDSDEFSRANLKFWFEQKKSKFWGKNSQEQKEETTSKETVHGTDETEETDDEDAVAINLPPDDASVAEAKPVGLAVAGAGGVAASKPVATAVVGPRGLAIAKPVATAIAGISPDDPMIAVYVDGLIKLPEKKKNKIPDRENQNNKEICNDKAADKCDKDNKGDKSPKKEKPKQDYLSHYREGSF